MEAINQSNKLSQHPWKEVMATFFQQNSPESVKLLFWRMFQCWVTKDCTIKGDVSDEEVALVFDQLIELVSAAYQLHQNNNNSIKFPEGKSHE